MHESVEAFVGIFMPCMSEVQVEHRGFELGVSQIALDEAGIDAGFKQMGGVGMAERMDGDTCFGDASALFGGTEGPLDTGATHGGCRCRTLGVIPPSGGKEPGGMTMGFPVGTEQHEGLGGQGDVAVFGAFTTMDMDLEALAVDVRDLQGEGFLEPEAQAINGGEIRLVVEGGGGREESLDLLYTEDSGESVGGLRA